VAQQTSVGIHISSAFPGDVSGTLTLAFKASGGNVDDPMVQFATGGRSVSFTIPANSTQAQFAGKANAVISGGTLAGAMTLTATVTSPSDLPPPPATATVNVSSSPP
jgi:hypothetical protein